VSEERPRSLEFEDFLDDEKNIFNRRTIRNFSWWYR
jgi:hypothetical protein